MTDQQTLIDAHREAQEDDLEALRRIERRQALDEPFRPVLSTSTRELLDQMGAPSAANHQPEVPPEPKLIDLTTRRAELFDAHAAALHQLHYLEGALNEIDYLLELTNPQPANTAEGAK